AYYSMFYLAQAALATRDIYRKKHSAVLSVFAEQFTKSGIVSKIIYRKLSKAFKERQVADYDFEISKTKVDAEQVLNYAEEFAKEVVSFLDKWTEENRSNG
ncbi:MAG TPA: HEPN domain-containing protein, partial [bacterium]